jgi:hypothetical protein
MNFPSIHAIYPAYIPPDLMTLTIFFAWHQLGSYSYVRFFYFVDTFAFLGQKFSLLQPVLRHSQSLSFFRLTQNFTSMLKKGKVYLVLKAP